VLVPQTTFDDLLDSVSTVQSFTVEQVRPAAASSQ
jgi:hypothetical protein